MLCTLESQSLIPDSFSPSNLFIIPEHEGSPSPLALLLIIHQVEKIVVRNSSWLPNRDIDGESQLRIKTSKKPCGANMALKEVAVKNLSMSRDFKHFSPLE